MRRRWMSWAIRPDEHETDKAISAIAEEQTRNSEGDEGVAFTIEVTYEADGGLLHANLFVVTDEEQSEAEKERSRQIYETFNSRRNQLVVVLEIILRGTDHTAPVDNSEGQAALKTIRRLIREQMPD